MKLTDKSLALFLALASDAGNWSGTPLFGGNVGSKAERGNLTQLKRAGLVTTFVDEDDRACAWVSFTKAGLDLAREHGVEVER